MRRILSFMMALVLVFSMSVNVFAAENTDPDTNTELVGSVTITNPTAGETYTIYKIFDANVKPADGTNKKAVSYSIQPDNQFFEDMFGDPTDPDNTYSNDVFIYNTDTGTVTLKEGVGESALISYLKSLITTEKTPAADPVKAVAGQKEIKFDQLPYGYYLITSSLGTAVTINSNTPDVRVIDKNQEPNSDDSFDKLVQDGVDADGNPIWVKANSANVGDMVNYKVSFNATNYHGDKLIEYYSIRDTKSSSLWLEFNSIEITIIEQKNADGTPVEGKSKTLTRGYYYCANDPIRTDEWEWLGDWGEVEKDPNNAEWYLIHYGYDEVEIVIPWLDDYTFTGIQDMVKGYELTFDFDKNDENNALSESMYGSPAEVEVTYSAAVGPDAANSTAENTAYLDWITADVTHGPEDPEKVETKVYNMGIIKTANDGNDTIAATRLAGATFEIFSDADCTQPVYVIPTNNEGVYILDDVNNDASGKNQTTARKKYAEYCAEYLEAAPAEVGQRNDVTTPENGQIVIAGLKAGTYYIKETVPPVGYNPLSGTVSVVVGSGTDTAFLTGYKDLADENGQMKDISYFVYKTTVVNSMGSELPATGGEGAVRMITLGSIIAMIFAVLLITQKKMSVYQD